jgi:hypothetical protein
MANLIKRRVPARLRTALCRLTELELGDLIELGPNNSIEEEACSEVTGAFTGGGGEPVAFLFPERRWHVVGGGSTAAELTAHLVRCGVVQTGDDGGHYAPAPFEVWVGQVPYTHSYILKRDCLVVWIDALQDTSDP